MRSRIAALPDSGDGKDRRTAILSEVADRAQSAPASGDLNCMSAYVDAPSDSFVDIAHLHFEQQQHAHVLQLLQTFTDSPWRRVRVNMNW
jgi:hypothetical protein